MPMTEPPRKATLSALFKPVRAALAVRTLALVATFMPMKPAKPEQSAPTANDSAMNGLVFSSVLVTASSTATMTTNQARREYSALRNAIAPSVM